MNCKTAKTCFLIEYMMELLSFRIHYSLTHLVKNIYEHLLCVRHCPIIRNNIMLNIYKDPGTFYRCSKFYLYGMKSFDKSFKKSVNFVNVEDIG